VSINNISVLAEGLRFPEGPAFAADGSLWVVEMKGEGLVQYKDGSLKRFHVGGSPNGIAIDGRKFDANTRKTVTVASEVDGETLNKPNDLAFDRDGNLVFTCPGESRKEPTGYACVLLRDGTVKKITSGKYFPNGVAFTNNGKQLVMAETYKHRLWIGDWNAETCEWTNERIWCDVGGPDGPGGPDGMAFNLEGELYVAMYGTGEIRMVDGEGKLFDKISLPAQNPTNCAFDPTGKLGLVVTEAEKGVLLSIDVNTKGMQLFDGFNKINFAQTK
jgi:gluconolactonase